MHMQTPVRCTYPKERPRQILDNIIADGTAKAANKATDVMGVYLKARMVQ